MPPRHASPLQSPPRHSRATTTGRTTPDAAGRALAWLERHIADQHLAPGDALPTELEIAAAAGVGRSSVREALTALKVLGIIRSRRKGGIRIIRDPVLLELRPYFAERYDSAARFEDAMEFRAAIEWGLAPLILARVHPGTLTALRAVLQTVAAATSPAQAAVEAAEVRFHTLLTLGSGNRLAGLFAKLYVPIFTPKYAIPPSWTGAPEEIAEWLREHGALIDALAAGDARRFLRLLKKHVHFQAGRATMR
jgi:DNA-binding FadR family transcriptional regulator